MQVTICQKVQIGQKEGATIPEGPELARSRDFLRKRLVGRRITEVQVLGGRYQKSPPEGLLDFQRSLVGNFDAGVVKAIDVKGKFMYWTFSGDWYLWCTYGMSGMWQLERTKHATLAVFHRTTQVDVLEDCTPGIYFNDPRHFGTLKFVKGKDALEAKLATLGPDMLNAPPNEEPFREALLRKGHKTLAEVLMDQGVVSGVGNYVKAEALHKARLSPHRRPDDLITVEVSRLRRAIIDVMKASYESGGATIATYRQGDGSEGSSQERFAVYGRKTDPLGNPVVKEETRDGRTTWWCPALQS